MFNLLPGIHPLTFGLGHMVAKEMDIPHETGGGGGRGGIATWYDNPYRQIDDDEIVEILSGAFGVINE